MKKNILRTVDPLAGGKRNQPMVVVFDAQDVNRDGILEIVGFPSSPCKDLQMALHKYCLR
jgi:hypothetical protein